MPTPPSSPPPKPLRPRSHILHLSNNRPSLPLPSIILTTDHGQLPNIPTPLLPHFPYPLLLHTTLSHWYPSTTNPFERDDINIHNFTNQKNVIWMLGNRRPGSCEGGINDNAGKKDGVIVRGMKVLSEEVIRLGIKMDVDIMVGLQEGVSLGDGVRAGNVGKKVRRSVDKCLKVGREFVEGVEGVERWDGMGRVFLGIEGGVDVGERRRCGEGVKGLVEEGGGSVGGVVIGGLYAGESVGERWEIVEEVVRELGGGKEVVVLGGGNGAPEEVIRAVGLGVDLVECSYPFDLAEGGWVLDLKSGVKRNVRDRKWVLDRRALVEGCACGVCNGMESQGRFSRAYLRHLFEVHEMLGPTLLSVHNLTVYMEWMSELRKSVEEGRFDEFELHFRKTREERRQGPPDLIGVVGTKELVHQNGKDFKAH